MHKPSDKIETYYKRVGKLCAKYDLLSHNDRILVGLSGGKDSLFLLEALANIKKHLPFRIELFVVHVRVAEVGYLADYTFLENFCSNLGLSLINDNISVDLFLNPQKAPCFVCSWYRRKRLFDLTRELNCNKLALGHHMDDALETMLMNMIYHGTISSLPAKLKMFNGRVYLIRPLIELMQKEMVHIAAMRGYPQLKKPCPYDDKTRRNTMRELVNKLESLNPLARKNMFRSMDNVFQEYLPSGLSGDDHSVSAES
jgi:tRNA 2-thiocytidine biosynthesis protein TtcA